MSGLPFKVGADPEIFVVDRNGDAVPAHGMIPGNKKEPHKVKDGAVQVDGLALEFNIDPADTKKEFKQRIKSVMGTLQDMLPSGLSFSQVASIKFGKKVYDALPEEAKVLGCDPDFNAYTMVPNVAPDPKQIGSWRVAGGHVHVGWTEGQDIKDNAHLLPCQQMVKQLDYAYMPAALLLDKDVVRKKWYGRAGAFRPKPYGVEYRTLSNFWIFNDDLIDHIYDMTAKAFIDLVDKDVDWFTLTNKYNAAITINQPADEGMSERNARHIIDTFSIHRDNRFLNKVLTDLHIARAKSYLPIKEVYNPKYNKFFWADKNKLAYGAWDDKLFVTNHGFFTKDVNDPNITDYNRDSASVVIKKINANYEAA